VHRPDRRRFLQAIPAGLVGLLAACRGVGEQLAESAARSTGPSSTVPLVDAVPAPAAEGITADPFRLGVASGDPTHDAVVLWTRLSVDPTAPGGGLGAGAAWTVAWDVAEDDGFTRVVASGVATAAAEDGHSIHADVTGLPADRWFHYRFRLGPWISPVGRTRTTPAPDARPAALVVVAASCQHYEAGTFVAHRHLAAEGADLVLFLGDFIYEGRATTGGVRSHPRDEARDLDGYRLRYAWYRADPDLQAASAAAPWAVVWDDHEVLNNYAGDRRSGGEPSAEFSTRRAAAYRAWWENQPVRLPRPDGDGLRIERELSWGRLARLVLLDGRSRRSPQACGGGVGDACAELDDPGRTMLGAEQEAWVSERFAAAGADGVTWTVLGNQTALGDLTVPRRGTRLTLFDQWDGYPQARRRLLGAARDGRVRNLVALTGDLHCSIATDVQLDGSVVGSELVVSSISSVFAPASADLFELGLQLLERVKLVDTRHRGYVRAEFGPDEARFAFRHVDDARDPASPIRTATRWRLRAGDRGLQKA